MREHEAKSGFVSLDIFQEPHNHFGENVAYFRLTASIDSGMLRVSALLEFLLMVCDAEELGRDDFKDAPASIDALAGRILILSM